MPLTLGICEIYHPKIHGNTSSSNININLHYIVHCIVELDDFMMKPRSVNNVNIEQTNYELILDYLFRLYNKINTPKRYIKHPSIENYDAIIRKNNYIRIDIIETHTLDGMEEVAILKTHWLRLVQRKWKRLYKNKKEILKKKMSWYYLKKREIYGGDYIDNKIINKNK